MGDLIVRLAGADDAPLVGQLLADFNAEFETAGPDAGTLTSRFSALLSREDVVVVLAEEPSPVGFAYLTLRPTPYFEGSLAQLEELYVVPSLRDDGIGTMLIELAVETVRAEGACEVHINVDEVDEDTRRFYERHGFTNVEPGKDYRMLCYLREL